MAKTLPAPPDWLPDWRDKDLYPRLPFDEGLWQFLRRDPRYQDDFAGLAAAPRKFLTGNAYPGRFEVRLADEPRRRRYGIDRLADPACPAAPPAFRRNLWLHGEKSVVFDFQGDIETIQAMRERGFRLPVVDLLQDINKQLRKIAVHLAGERRRLLGGRRWDPRDWPKYLRTLDARAVGAPFAEISRTIGPIHKSMKRKTHEKRGRDWYEAARRIQNALIAD